MSGGGVAGAVCEGGVWAGVWVGGGGFMGTFRWGEEGYEVVVRGCLRGRNRNVSVDVDVRAELGGSVWGNRAKGGTQLMRGSGRRVGGVW